MKGSTKIYISIGIVLYIWITYWLFPMDIRYLLTAYNITNGYEILQLIWLIINLLFIVGIFIIAIIFLIVEDFGISKKLDKWFKL